MAIAALLKTNPSPSAEAIAALPNICRCGAYPQIRQAIARAAKSAAGPQQAAGGVNGEFTPTSSDEEH